MKKSTLIIIAIIAVIVLIQFINTRENIPNFDQQTDFISIHKPDGEVKDILVSTCYDCHSYESKFPWYANVAPVSWWINGHIHEGREHLNFSEWANYDHEKAAHKLEEMVEEVEEGKMPLESYTWMHHEAKLTEEQRQKLIDWVKAYPMAEMGIEPEAYGHEHDGDEGQGH